MAELIGVGVVKVGVRGGGVRKDVMRLIGNGWWQRRREF